MYTHARTQYKYPHVYTRIVSPHNTQYNVHTHTVCNCTLCGVESEEHLTVFPFNVVGTNWIPLVGFPLQCTVLPRAVLVSGGDAASLSQGCLPQVSGAVSGDQPASNTTLASLS